MNLQNTDVAFVMENCDTGKVELILCKNRGNLLLEVDAPTVSESGEVLYTALDREAVTRLKKWLNVAFPED